MKKVFFTIIATLCVVAVCFCACTSRSAVDGRDGNDFDPYVLYQAYVEESEKAGEDPLSYLDFIKSYLTIEYNDSELDSVLSLEASINRSLLSSVTVLATFSGTDRQGSSVTSASIGSGVIVDIDIDAGNAYIVTNCHVIYSEEITTHYSTLVHVALYGQEDYMYSHRNTTTGSVEIVGGIKAEIVAASPMYDLALLKIENSSDIQNSHATAASFAETDCVSVGETVYAIGNPGGYGVSATRGIISKESEYIGIEFDSKDDICLYYRVLRTDASLNSGNSGGGLFNADGKLVGIVNSKADESKYEGISYALPSSMVRRVVDAMIESDDDDSSTIDIGVSKIVLDVQLGSDYRSSYMDEFGSVHTREAVYVNAIKQTGGVGKNIFEIGDVIDHFTLLASDGTVKEDLDIEHVYDLVDALISVRVGDIMFFDVYRDGVKISLQDVSVTPSMVVPGSEYETMASEMREEILYYV